MSQNFNQTNQWIGQRVEKRSNCTASGVFSPQETGLRQESTRGHGRGWRIVACLSVLVLSGVRSWQQPTSYVASEVVSINPATSPGMQSQPGYTADIIDDIINVITGGGGTPPIKP